MTSGLMARTGVGPRRFVDRQTVVDVMPICRARSVSRIDAERLDNVDQLQSALNLGASRRAATGCHRRAVGSTFMMPSHAKVPTSKHGTSPEIRSILPCQPRHLWFYPV